MTASSTENKRPGQQKGGVQFGPGIGKFLFRGIASPKAQTPALAPQHAGFNATARSIKVELDRAVRLVARSDEHLHDLAKDVPVQRPGAARSDQSTRHLKRKWVMNQMSKLVALDLVRVEPRARDRPTIIVLRDDGTRQPFDDPGEAGGYDDDRYSSMISADDGSPIALPGGQSGLSEGIACAPSNPARLTNLRVRVAVSLA
jgi:hypothetical protein